MPRRLLWLMMPVIAVAVPPLVYHAPQWWAVAKQRVAPLLSIAAGTEGGAAAGATLGATPSPGSPATTASPGTSLGASEERVRRQGEAPVQVDPADVLRFDLTPAWVMQQWPWVTAGLSQLTLQGYRVPLVTGTAADDLAGSLTYYFNARQTVEQITFEGTTGDATKLLRVLVGRYGFGRRLTNDPGLFRYEVPETRGPAKSFLNVRLVQPNDAYRRYHVEMVMLRPAE
jgi:hypothetical protein